jgi:hypothetical protein
MNYDELLKKYRAGELSAQESAALEADIEKHESIMDFLLERMETEEPPVEELAAADSDSSKDFVKEVNRAIRRAFLVAGAVTAAVVLALKALGINETVQTFALIVTATPLGLNTIVYPATYGGDTKTGASMAIISHTLCVITIPIMYALLTVIA